MPDAFSSTVLFANQRLYKYDDDATLGGGGAATAPRNEAKPKPRG